MKRYLPLALAIIALALLLLTGPGTRAGLFHFRTGFTIMKWASYAGIATMVVSVIYLLVPRLRANNLTPLIIAFIIGAAVFYMPWSFRQKGKGVPPIHDITTDTERPPEFVSILPLRANAANPPEYAGPETATQQKQAYPDIQPVLLEIAPDSVFTLAHRAAEKMGWEIVAADSAAGRVEATATTTWFGFKDDVVIRIEPADRGTRVDVRSKSRVGRGDVGANAARIRKYIETLKGE
jgi:uncharacterized protein (DUF1499 family)